MLGNNTNPVIPAADFASLQRIVPNIVRAHRPEPRGPFAVGMQWEEVSRLSHCKKLLGQLVKLMIRMTLRLRRNTQRSFISESALPMVLALSSMASQHFVCR